MHTHAVLLLEQVVTTIQIILQQVNLKVSLINYDTSSPLQITGYFFFLVYFFFLLLLLLLHRDLLVECVFHGNAGFDIQSLKKNMSIIILTTLTVQVDMPEIRSPVLTLCGTNQPTCISWLALKKNTSVKWEWSKREGLKIVMMMRMI